MPNKFEEECSRGKPVLEIGAPALEREWTKARVEMCVEEEGICETERGKARGSETKGTLECM